MLPHRFHTDRRNGKLLGVCAGFADYSGIDVTFVRVAYLLTILLTGGFGGLGIIGYFLVGWLADDRARYERDDDRRPRRRSLRTVREVRTRFRELDRRLADIEADVTSRERRLADEIEALR